MFLNYLCTFNNNELENNNKGICPGGLELKNEN